MEAEPSTSLVANSNETNVVTGQVWKRYCCIPQCKSNNRKNPELSFYKIPKNPDLKKKWVRLLKRKGVREPVQVTGYAQCILWKARKHIPTTFRQFLA